MQIQDIKLYLRNYLAAVFLITLLMGVTYPSGGVHSAESRIDLTHIIHSKPGGIGLALSGGGAQGFAQIGVIKVLEEYNIPISHIAGTSIGAVVGGLYASGYSARDLESIVLSRDWTEMFSDSPNRLSLFLTQRQQRERHLLQVRFDGLKPYIPQALTGGQKVSNYLYEFTVGSSYTAGADFDDLKIPFRAVATDLITGTPVILSSGDLAEAMRASISVPLAFTPVEYGESLLVDGGIICPVPTEVARQMGADKVVAINTVTPLYPRERLKNALDIANQATSVMVMEKTEEQLNSADLVIEPRLSHYANMEFNDIKSLIDEGEKAARKALPDIYRLLEKEPAGNDTTYFINEIAGDITDEPFPSAVNKLSSFLYRDVHASEIEEVRDYLLSTGLYHDVKTNIESHSDHYTLRLEREPYPVVSYIEFDGNTIFSDEALRKYIGIEPGERLNTNILRAGLESIENLYRNSHYPLIKIEQVFLEGNKLKVEISEGTVSNFEITGNEHTRRWIVMRDFPDLTGQPYNSLEIQKGVDRLYNTGLFEKVATNIIPRERKGNYTLRLKLKEKHSWAARIGLRYDDEYNLQGMVELGDYNVFGSGSELFMRGKIGDRERSIRPEFRADRLFKTHLTYSVYAQFGRREIDIFIDHRARKLYTQSEISAGFKFGQQISRLGTASLELRVADITQKFENRKEDFIRIRSITLRSVVDTKDKQSFPERGKYHHTYFEWANDILGGNDVYSKFYMSLESYYPLPFGFNFHPRGAIGISTNGLPLPEKFRLGEPYGFGGFNYHEIVGDNFFAYFLKLRKALGKGIYLYSRYDAGRTYSERSDVVLSNFRHSITIGAAAATPLGPLDISYGYYNETIDKFSLTWGYQF
ncbi:MAG: BamA/TamA family outer membrane protein [candidate division Zixibacteria bacterium]|nr:BamA/TamA family outer membrane protein [candidate division Zixibacteria bacterium]